MQPGSANGQGVVRGSPECGHPGICTRRGHHVGLAEFLYGPAEAGPCGYVFDGITDRGSGITLDVLMPCRGVEGHLGSHFYEESSE